MRFDSEKSNNNNNKKKKTKQKQNMNQPMHCLQKSVYNRNAYSERTLFSTHIILARFSSLSSCTDVHIGCKLYSYFVWLCGVYHEAFYVESDLTLCSHICSVLLSIVLNSLGEDRPGLYTSLAFVCLSFMRYILSFSLPLDVRD